MASDGIIHPQVLWAQRNDKVFLTICVEDSQENKIELTATELKYSGVGGKERKPHSISMEFYGETNPDESKQIVLARHIEMVIIKKEDGPYWPRLLKDKAKVHWLKTNFDKWRDEDDSEDEGGDENMKLEEMMKQMGNFKSGGPGGGFDPAAENEEEDSDDEELPDLE